MKTCAVCGRPSRYIFVFPSQVRVGVGVVFDGAQVCSSACAQMLREQRTREPGREPDSGGEPGRELPGTPDGAA